MTDPFFRFRRPALNIAATCAVAAMTCANALPGAVGFALAQDQTGVDIQDSQAQDPSTQDGLSAWENSQARSTDPQVGVRVDLTKLTTSAQSIDAQLSIRNDTSAPLSAISVRVLSQPPAENAAAVRSAQLANFGEYPQSSALLNIPDSIAQGETHDFTLHLVPNASGSPESTNTLVTPSLFRSGSHPVMFAVSGDAQSNSQQEASQQLAGVARTTVSMTRPQATDVKTNPENTTNTPTPVTFVWPLAAETHALGGATGEAPQRGPLYLSDEHLADELAENGRLRTLLDTYRKALNGPQGSQLKQASCIAVDPELIDTVERMSHGYRIGSERPSPVDVPQQLRDSWGQIFGGDEPQFEDGRGAEDARRWIEDLKNTVDQGCSVALPYAGADLNTIATTQQDWLGVHALSQGPQIIHRVLGVWPTQNVVFPDAGYLTPAAAPLLRHADTLGKDIDLSEKFEKRVRHGGNVADASADEAPASANATDSTQRDTVTAIVAGNTLNVTENPDSASAQTNGITPVPLADISGSVPQSVRDQAQINVLGYSADLGSALRATGSQPEIAAYSDPSKRFNVEEDSDTARMADATAVYNEEVEAGHAVVAVPPALWSVDKDGAQSFLDAVASSLQDRRAEAKPLSSVVQEPTSKGNLVESYTDPGALSSAELTRIAEQSNALGELTTTMGNDPTIALTREAFTRPLYDDLTRATSSYRMRERSAWAEMRGKLARRLDEVQKMITSLQNSVSLVPPGNVFTRTSESSPLLVLARNGLPLPVPINLDYETTDNQPLTLTLPDDTQSIPAKGSITLSLTTSTDSTEAANGNQTASESDPTTNFSLWLSSQSGHRITEPVDLRVQSVPGVSPMMAIGVAVLLAGVGIVGKVLWGKRTRRTQQGSNVHRPGRPEKLQLDDN